MLMAGSATAMRLGEVLARAEKLANRVTLLYNAASATDERARRREERTFLQTARLKELFAAIERQKQLLPLLRASLQLRVKSLEQQLLPVVQTRSETVEQLRRVFNTLRSAHVPPTLQTSGESTLYDYVDTEGLTALSRQTENSLLAAQETKSRVENLVVSCTELLEDLMKGEAPFPTLQLLNDSASTIRRNEVEAIMRTADSIVRFKDSLNGMYQQAMQSSSDLDTFAVECQLNELKDLEKEAQRIETRMERIEALVEQAEDAVETRKAFQALIKYAAALQNGETVIASHLTNAQECEVVFSQYLESAKAMTNEIQTLIHWYRMFHVAYQELPAEVLRRLDAQDRVTRLLDHFFAQLEQYSNDEDHKREEWHENYGQYLPSTLLPALMERAPRYTISTDREPAKLPHI